MSLNSLQNGVLRLSLTLSNFLILLLLLLLPLLLLLGCSIGWVEA
jgi:hypothetical protein